MGCYLRVERDCWNDKKWPDDFIPEGKVGLIPATHLHPYSWPQRIPNARSSSPSSAGTSHCCRPSCLVHTEPTVRDRWKGALAYTRRLGQGRRWGTALGTDASIWLSALSSRNCGTKAGHLEPWLVNWAQWFSTFRLWKVTGMAYLKTTLGLWSANSTKASSLPFITSEKDAKNTHWEQSRLNKSKASM